MSKVCELILKYSYRNLNKMFCAVIAVSYGKKYYKVFKISHFCVTAWRNQRIKRNGQ